MTEPRQCSVDGCERSRDTSYGWCLKHYKRWKRHGDPIGSTPTRAEKGCTIEGCGEPHCARGWCRRHYYKWRETGSPLTPNRPTGKPAQSCRVDGCNGKRDGGGMCGKHYKRWRKWGDPRSLGYANVDIDTPTTLYLIVNRELGAVKIGVGVETRLRKWRQRGWALIGAHTGHRDHLQEVEAQVLATWRTTGHETGTFPAELLGGDGASEVVAYSSDAIASAMNILNQEAVA